MDGFLASLEPWMVYLAVGVLTFGESAAFLGLVLPGEVALVTAAALGMSAGAPPVILGVVAALGSSLGGIAGYAIGQRYGLRLAAWSPVAQRMREPMLRFAPHLTAPRAGVLVALGRFNQITRAAVPALAGMVSMDRVRFGLANLVGGVLWAAVFTSIGYFAAEWWRAHSGDVHVITAIGLAATVAAWVLLSRASKRWGPGLSRPG